MSSSEERENAKQPIMFRKSESELVRSPPDLSWIEQTSPWIYSLLSLSLFSLCVRAVCVCAPVYVCVCVFSLCLSFSICVVSVSVSTLSVRAHA
jgi:hypothetical protein